MDLNVDIVSAEGEIFSGNATMVFAPAEMGEVGIAPRHAPLLTRLKAGEVRVQSESGSDQSFFVSGGMLEIQPYQVTVMADTAARGDELDENAALEAKKRAEEALKDQASDVDLARAQAELAEAAARLHLVQKLKGKR